MSDFEMVIFCMIIPVVYIMTYIAGKYDVLNLICKMLAEKIKECEEEKGGAE